MSARPKAGPPPRARKAAPKAAPKAARKAPRAARAATPRRAAPVRVLVLRAPGTNCDRETAHAFGRAGAEPLVRHVNAVLARPRILAEVRALVIPGGFSFGDDLGAGTVLGTLLRERLRDPLRALVDRGGLVLGICNGFQVLVRTGLLPGWPDDPAPVALAFNAQGRYEDRWVTLRVETDRSPFLVAGDLLRCPVAHAEGRFLPRDAAVLERLRAAGQVALRYVAPGGGAPAPFPANPNGAVDDVAGLVDPTGRVLGLMPHPERHQFPWQDPLFHAGRGSRTPDGLTLFQRAVAHLKG